MTLILSQASFQFVLQVSDRLVTRAARPFDPVSNKSLLYLAPDALVTMAYTGAAYLNGTPTDQWLAEIISGDGVRQGRAFLGKQRPAGISIGPIPQWRHIGPLFQLVRERLATAFSSPRMSRAARTMMFELLVVGWQWNRRGRVRPIAAGIRKAATSQEIKVWRSARHFGRKFVFAGTPETNLLPAEVDAMRARLARIRSADEAENILVDTIRSVACRIPHVGSDCLSVLIPPPGVRKVRVRYISPNQAKLAVVSASDRRVTATLPAAFSPWVIGPGLVQAPSVLSGHIGLVLGDLEVELEAPAPVGSGIRGAMGAVVRPPEPR